MGIQAQASINKNSFTFFFLFDRDVITQIYSIEKDLFSSKHVTFQSTTKTKKQTNKQNEHLLI